MDAVCDVDIGYEGDYAWAFPLLGDVCDPLADLFFRAASYLTDPVCKTHELWRSIQVVDAKHDSWSAAWRGVLKACMVGEMLLLGVLALPTAPVGIVARKIACWFQRRPFQWIEGAVDNKIFEGREITVLSANICCVGGGYSISDGGVVPWPERIDQIAQEILNCDADVVCLQEVFDEHAWSILKEKLGPKYAHCFGNMGPRGIGPPSGLVVFSKYEIRNAEFTAFPEDMLVGRTKNSTKGFFTGDLYSEDEHIATVVNTHLQHSEEPEYPTEEEVTARRREMDMIMDKIHSYDPSQAPVILTGDLNLDDDEFSNSEWSLYFDRDLPSMWTWLGDEFCAKLVGGGKRVSSALNLDYTLLAKGSGWQIATTVIPTYYDASVYSGDALSDHQWLLSAVSAA